MVHRTAVLVAAAAVAVAAALTLSARPALALSCADSRPFLSPGDGSVLPPNPVVYLFTPFEPAPPAVTVDGLAAEATATEIGTNRGYRVYAVRVEAPAGSKQLVVELGPSLVARYRIHADWRRPAEPLRWLEPRRRAWGGGFGLTGSHLALRADVPAPAYRVWSGPTPEADAVEVVVPGLGEGGQSVHVDPRDELDVCEGLFAPAAAGHYARAAALFADGTESPPAGPVRLEAPGWSARVRVLSLLLGAALLVAALLLTPGGARPRGGH